MVCHCIGETTCFRNFFPDMILSRPGTGVTCKDVDSSASLTTTTSLPQLPLPTSLSSQNLHPSGAGLPSKIPASAAEIRSLSFNWLLVRLLLL
jgi:hypothetical protein